MEAIYDSLSINVDGCKVHLARSGNEIDIPTANLV
jgi:hypothetical protein